MLPMLLSGPTIGYTAAALQHKVQGNMQVKCKIDSAGAVLDCFVLKGLAYYMNEVTVEALLARRYSPARWNGSPIGVDYTFNINFVLPR